MLQARVLQFKQVIALRHTLHVQVIFHLKTLHEKNVTNGPSLFSIEIGRWSCSHYCRPVRVTTNPIDKFYWL